MAEIIRRKITPEEIKMQHEGSTRLATCTSACQSCSRWSIWTTHRLDSSGRSDQRTTRRRAPHEHSPTPTWPRGGGTRLVRELESTLMKEPKAQIATTVQW